MKTKYYLLIAFTAYFFFLLATLPAKPVIEMLAADLDEIKINSVRGSLWNGQAEQLIINGTYTLNKVHWNTQFLRVIFGELALDINAVFEKQNISAQIGLSVSGNVVAQNIRGRIDAETLADLAEIPLAQLAGLISIDLDTLHWRQGEIPIASGEIYWKNARITVAETVQLGNVHIQLVENDENQMQATISNQGGNLKTDGQATLDSLANYNLSLALTPSSASSKNLTNSLSMFAKKQNNGSFLVKYDGKLDLPQ